MVSRTGLDSMKRSNVKYFTFIGPCIITYELLNVTNERHLIKTVLLLLSLLYMFWALLAHHQELTETVSVA